MTYRNKLLRSFVFNKRPKAKVIRQEISLQIFNKDRVKHSKKNKRSRLPYLDISQLHPSCITFNNIIGEITGLKTAAQSQIRGRSRPLRKSIIHSRLPELLIIP